MRWGRGSVRSVSASSPRPSCPATCQPGLDAPRRPARACLGELWGTGGCLPLGMGCSSPLQPCTLARRRVSMVASGRKEPPGHKVSEGLWGHAEILPALPGTAVGRRKLLAAGASSSSLTLSPWGLFWSRQLSVLLSPGIFISPVFLLQGWG